MLKALLLLILNLALAGIATAQTNLVLNGSFEDTVSCDLPVIGIRKATHWYTVNTATPDVWDADLDRECGSPLDPVGFPGSWYIEPYDGLRHAGAFYWYGPGSSNTREYIMTRLDSPLQNGEQYEVSLACALSGTMKYAVDHIGIWVGMDSLFEPQPNWLNVTPQLKLRDTQQPYLAETETWTPLKDTLVANGGEQWLVIGNFDVADSVNGVNAYPNAVNAFAYYYLDAISVRLVDRPVSVVENALVGGWQGEGLWMRWPRHVELTEIIIWDAQGRRVLAEPLNPKDGQALFRVPSLATGVYIVQGNGPTGRLTTRILKEVRGF